MGFFCGGGGGGGVVVSNSVTRVWCLLSGCCQEFTAAHSCCYWGGEVGGIDHQVCPA